MSCTKKELNTSVSECTYIDPSGIVILLNGIFSLLDATSCDKISQ